MAKEQLDSSVAKDHEHLRNLAYEFRGTDDASRRKDIKDDYALTVRRLVASGRWTEMPSPEEQLPSELMPEAYYDFLYRGPETRAGRDQLVAETMDPKIKADQNRLCELLWQFRETDPALRQRTADEYHQIVKRLKTTGVWDAVCRRLGLLPEQLVPEVTFPAEPRARLTGPAEVKVAQKSTAAGKASSGIGATIRGWFQWVGQLFKDLFRPSGQDIEKRKRAT
jgi:hypothetical protein